MNMKAGPSRCGFLKGAMRCRGTIATNMAISKSIDSESESDQDGPSDRSLRQPKRVVAVQPLSVSTFDSLSLSPRMQSTRAKLKRLVQSSMLQTMRNTSRYPDKPPNGVGPPKPFVEGQGSEGEIKIVKGPPAEVRALPSSQILANYSSAAAVCDPRAQRRVHITLRLETIPSPTHARSLIHFLFDDERWKEAAGFHVACLVVL
ncbi:hypothetical protein BJV78DRAFT_950345 [Lactifluus subvellereus]|nr:hypothetical protein BJV78DRAFT_950345 [Lactifluus subvellereus]